MDAITEAGEKIREVYDTDFEVIKKDDNSPITKADLESNKILRSALEKTGIPILSEEDEDDKSRLESEKVWIIDPLDGTQDFVNRTGEFTVLVGLVENIALYYMYAAGIGIVVAGAINYVVNRRWTFGIKF